MAIDTARAVLRSAGVMGSGEATSGDGLERGRFEEPAAVWRGGDAPLDGLEGLPCERVRVEGRVILSQGSDSAEEAALTLASLLEA